MQACAWELVYKNCGQSCLHIETVHVAQYASSHELKQILCGLSTAAAEVGMLV